MARPTQITDETILDALTARPEVTSADLAAALGMGQSTAGKRLGALEADGRVRRTPGGRQAGRRVPDRWSPAGPAPAALALAPDPEPDAGSETSDAEPDPVEATDDAGDAEVGVAADAGVDGHRRESGRRLGRGELGSLVRDYLAARPDESFGPAAVGKALGRSQGAISNSLAAMAAHGEVVLVGDKPRRYRIATGS